MRLIPAAWLGLVLLVPAHAQTGSEPEHIVRRNIDLGVFEGHDQKVIGGLGDAGAVLVTKILAGRDLTSNTIDNALVVIEAVFADPSSVKNAADRQPRTALLLLRYLDQSTGDGALKMRVADTRKYVEDRSQAYKIGTAP